MSGGETKRVCLRGLPHHPQLPPADTPSFPTHSPAPPTHAPVDMLEPATLVVMRNARVDMFKGSMRLTVDRWGKVDAAEPGADSFEPKVGWVGALVHGVWTREGGWVVL